MTRPARSPWAKFNVQLLSETTRLHDYDATGDIKDDSDMVHTLLRSVMTTWLLFSHTVDFLLKGFLGPFGGARRPLLRWLSIK